VARIRSIHPSLFTDEHYMALTFPARELLKGLWCESDDQGIFEWKPLTLKARLMPADNVDMMALLLELEDGNFIRPFDHDGKRLGAVRNFRRFQRPKKPNAVHYMPVEFRTYVGLKADGSPPDADKTDEVPPKGERSPQMEDGGGRMVREEERVIQKEEFKNSNSLNGTVPPLKSSTIEEAKKLAPRYDVYHIENQFREHNAGRKLINADKAFLGFVRTHVERNPLT
jgi:hypothetical protein